MNEGELGLRRGDVEGLDPVRAGGCVGEVGTKDERAKLSLLSLDEDPCLREERRWRPGEGGSGRGVKVGGAEDGSRTRTMVSLDEDDRLGSWLMLAFFPKGSGALTDPRRAAMCL